MITGDIEPARLQRLKSAALPWLPKPVMPMRLRSWLGALPATADPEAGELER